MNNKQGYILGILSGVSVLLSNTWAAQPMSESALATQTGAINASLPVIIAKAQDDAKKPAIEQKQVQQALGDNYLQQVRWDALRTSVLSPYQEQKQNHVVDSKEKKKLEMIALPERADRFTKYDFESKNVHGEVIITVK
ncbi:hypothetical protein QLG01_01820 [Acinetobacter sp. V89_4]|uniref:Uncharacterized protein n=1 Tax=Acinetobacter oleivorans (strain JCM 16667 / KCTC 23045 / DR1) TaxID=436717 RepID=A0AAN0PA34_ACISD|nr:MULTISPECIES: hypothetical protein [Acinetobacter]ADI91585.1 hypothetical protein AOLE_13490 [Acinetobacter oleivorans DR1]ESK44422.1 hypothetical protein P254_01944 [Acinetobacter oleivorans CIP 110421]MDI3451933.1 hypothetical protein [Acinetobacter sp. V89_4]